MANRGGFKPKDTEDQMSPHFEPTSRGFKQYKSGGGSGGGGGGGGGSGSEVAPAAKKIKTSTGAGGGPEKKKRKNEIKRNPSTEPAELEILVFCTAAGPRYLQEGQAFLDILENVDFGVQKLRLTASPESLRSTELPQQMKDFAKELIPGYLPTDTWVPGYQAGTGQQDSHRDKVLDQIRIVTVVTEDGSARNIGFNSKDKPSSITVIKAEGETTTLDLPAGVEVVVEIPSGGGYCMTGIGGGANPAKHDIWHHPCPIGSNAISPITDVYVPHEVHHEVMLDLFHILCARARSGSPDEPLSLELSRAIDFDTEKLAVSDGTTIALAHYWKLVRDRTIEHVDGRTEVEMQSMANICAGREAHVKGKAREKRGEEEPGGGFYGANQAKKGREAHVKGKAREKRGEEEPGGGFYGANQAEKGKKSRGGGRPAIPGTKHSKGNIARIALAGTKKDCVTCNLPYAASSIRKNGDCRPCHKKKEAGDPK